MEKPTWKKIDANSSKPCPRWGHSCCIVGDEILIFGGYADSHYMNDLWTYHATQRKWTEIATSGERPSHRSNCSLSYDSQTNQVVVFGGGGPNKQRFNSVNVLDWNTKIWSELTPAQNQPAPWERTYHVAELKFPYLIVFGGQGLTDMDDLWVFNLTTHRWKEVKMQKEVSKPCARRFHSSCMIGNEFFIIAGCHGKYRCLSDIYSLDLSPLMSSGDVSQLKWTERKLKGASFLSRWGHSSAVFDQKIYVFAGRFSSDLNDVLVIDIANNSLKGLKISGNVADHPKPRRRHCAGFIGSCMTIFGGFNGQYFNDLYYVNVLELKQKAVFSQEEKLAKLAGSYHLADSQLTTSMDETVPIHTPLLARHFSSEQELVNFLELASNTCSKQQLVALFQALYRGYGSLKGENISQLNISLPESLNRRWLVNNLLKEEPNERNMLTLAHQICEKEWVVGLKRKQFQTFFENRRNQWFLDCDLLVGQSRIPINKGLLRLHSQYFRNLLSNNFNCAEMTQVPLHLPYSPVVVEMLVNSLMVGSLVVPVDYSAEGWMQIAELSQYFSLPEVTSVCEMQLCNRVDELTFQQLGEFAQKMEMSNLSMQCARLQLVQGQGSSEGAKMLKDLLRLELAHCGKQCMPMQKGDKQQFEDKQNKKDLSNFKMNSTFLN